MWYGLVATLTLATTPTQEPRPISEDAARDDIALLREAVQTVHAGLGRYAPEESFVEACLALEDGISGDTSDLDLYREISVLMAELRCGHTRVDGPKWLEDYRSTEATLLPFHFVLFDGRMYVDSPVEGIDLPRGAEVLSIDGVSIADRIEQIAPTVPVDGWTDAIRPSRLQTAYEYQESGFDHFLPMFDRFRSRFGLEVRLPGLEGTTSVVVEAATLEAWRAAKPGGGWTDFADEVSWLKLDETSALLRVGTFVNYRRPVDPETTFSKIFQEIAESGCEHLVVDLRDCGGGSADVGWMLARFLIDEPIAVGGTRRVRNIRFDGLVEHLSTWIEGAFYQPVENFRERDDGWFEILGESQVQLAPHPDGFDGQITVLTGPFNASGSTMLLAKLQEAGSVELVGEPTGGSAEGPTAGLLFTLTLPNSGIRVNLPVVREATGVASFREGYGVNPDRPVTPTIEDFLAARDPVLEEALQGTLLHLNPTDTGGEDWTRFRGASATSNLEERSFPAEWGPDKNIAWRVDVPGSGWSSPIVARGRVFLTSALDPQDDGPKGMSAGVMDPSTRGAGAKPEGELTFRLACYDLAGGKEIWSRDVGKRVPLHPVHRSNTFATESPTTDGERIFVTFGALGELVCFDFDGEELWRQETGVFRTGNDFGWGISLVTHDGLVFLQNDNEEASFLAAFETKTGRERWRVKRGLGTSWGTPVLWTAAGRTSLVACGPDTVVAYDPATGEEHWQLEGMGGSFSSSPTFDDERIYFGNSGPMSRGPLMAVNASATGTVTATAEDSEAIAWRAERSGPGFASPVVHEGLIYILGSSNVLACHDAATGEQLWRERVPDAGQIVATPWIAGGELHIMDEAGTTVVIDAGPEYDVLRTNRLDGLYWGTPSVAGNALLLREAGSLFCIRE